MFTTDDCIFYSVKIDISVDCKLTAILRVVFQPLVWSDRSHEVINRHSSKERWVRLFGLYPSEMYIRKPLYVNNMFSTAAS